MRPVLLNWIRRRPLTRCASNFGVKNEAAVPAASKFQIKDVAVSDTPIEKVSLSRGLVMNKFEKDFMIYPEYTDTDDVKAIQGFTEVLRKTLQLTVDHKELEKQGSLTDAVKGALNDSTVYAALTPSEYGGLGLGYKDRVKMFEDISMDWNIYANVAAVNALANTLLLFGSTELKEKYFPFITSGKCRPVIAFVDDSSDSSTAEVIGGARTKSLIRLENTRCIGMHNANLAIVFASSAHHDTKEKYYSCYLIDRSELKETDQWEFKRDETSGLKACDIGSLTVSISLTEEHLIGELGQGVEVRDELASINCLPLAAASAGYGKRLLNGLAAFCNRTPSARRENDLLSNDPGLQYTTTEFALKVYALESASYYLAGLLDERLPVVLDIENALIHKLTRDVLRSSVFTCVDLAGLRALDPAFHFEKDIRDVTTLLSLSREESMVESVAIATLSSWASVSHKRIANSLKRLLRQETLEDELRYPKLKHYIAEHAHPSLQAACQDLEFSMSRVHNVISKMVAETGKNVQHDFATLDRLVTVIQNHLVMVAVISRASRSYSIGLRNSDVEIAWTTFICARASRENWFLLEALNDYFGLIRLNPSLVNVGKAIFDMGGYQIESPIERNW
ncbi:Acyl CoA DeHydrogenase [Trichostrongylus colubriformis]|uniref:Acyl CoA DeHydrogenase n=1 Tax=Trichostrongylus colubriformis TaxID=6319 RepID=A0AAN8FU50_TRICO